jgi:hypothetical protein
MTQTFDAQQMALDGVTDATDTTTRPPAPVYAYHIFLPPGEIAWAARYHRMIFSEPVPYDEAVQSVLGGHSCYVERDGLQTAIEHLATFGVTVNVDTPGAGKRGM